MLLRTIRLGRHGFYGLGRGNNFTARGRNNDNNDNKDNNDNNNNNLKS